MQVPAGLVSWWRAEGSGADSAGLNPGTAYNGASFGSGFVGQAFVFDGTDDHIRVADSPSLHFTNALTVEAWVYPTIINADRGIVVKWEGILGLNQGSFSFSETADGRLYLHVSPTGSSYGTTAVFSTNHLELNQWSHVAGTYDGAALRVYINGALEGSVAYSDGIYPSPADMAISGLVGGLPPGGVDAPFAGRIDEVALYNRALTAAEIKAVYDARNLGKCGAPVIIVQPGDQSVIAGADAVFSVQATGSGQLSYQWNFNGTDIPGATDTSLTLHGVLSSAAGVYQVRVSNSVGSVLSSNATLTVNEQCVTAPADLVSWWRAENTTADVAGDNSGTAYGGVGFADGKVGTAFVLDGTRAHVRVPDSQSLRFGAAMTVETWVYPVQGGNNVNLISKWDSVEGPEQRSYGLGIYPDQKAYLSVSRDGTAAGVLSVITTNPLPLNNWTHLAASYDGKTLTIYRDGTFEGSASYPEQGTIFAGTNDLCLGGAVGGALQGQAGFLFEGMLDEPSLYARALSAAEIQGIYIAGSKGKCGPALPLIVAQPTSQTVTQGVDVTFTVEAAGGAVFTYQWMFNGVDLSGATDSSLLLKKVQPNQSGPYRVRVANRAGAVFSSNAVLQVTGPCVDVSSGLISWWRANGDAKDAVGGNSGTLYSGASFGPGLIGDAFALDGADDHIRVPDSPSLRLTNALTIEGWVNPTVINAGRSIVVKWEGIPGLNQAGYSFSENPDGRIYLHVSPTGSSYDTTAVFSTNALLLNTWSHVAGTYDGSVLRVFINGNLEGELGYTNGIYPSTVDLGIGGLVGGFAPGGVDAPFAGEIDEVAIYGRALSPAEIKSVYDAGAGGKCVVPIAPFIISQPVSQTNLIGETTTFLASAGGTWPLGYQWTSNGIAIQSATNTSLVLTNLELSDGANYAVTVTNAYGSVTSSNAVLTVLAAPPCAPVPANLVSWWMAEGNAVDLAGGNDGTLSGTTFAPGKVGNSFAFDGLDDFVLIGNPENLRLTNLTIEAWLRRASATEITRSENATNGWPREGFIFGYGAGGYGLFLDFGGRLVFGRTGGQYALGMTAAVSDTNWHHVAVARTNNSVSFYIDGQRKTNIMFGSTFFFTNSAGIGARPDNLRSEFYGQIDELTVYSRALANAEIAALYNARMAGKCAPNYPPLVTVQPVDQTVYVGANPIFTVQVAGTPPFTYQWKRNGTDLEGETKPWLALTNVQMSQRGEYSVGITNQFGGTVSSNAVLSVVLPPALVKVVDTVAGPAGATASVPVLLVANGNENALGFSLNFDPLKLTFVDATLGSSVPDAHLLVSPGLVGSGKLGLAIALPTGTVMLRGTQEVARVYFATAPAGVAVTTQLSFGDQPTLREVADAAAMPLPSEYAPGVVSYAASQFEADVAPRGDGNAMVTIIDWVQAGRYVARLDYPTNASEFQRADCAPRSTRGDGAITVNDWVQAGRYAAGIDPLQAAGGPTEAVNPGLGGPIRQDAQVRTIKVGDGLLLDVADNQISVQLEAQGDESALSFSLSFDKSALVYMGAEKGSGAGDATLNINTALLDQGKIGFAAGVMNHTFGAGLRELVKLTFRAATNSGSYPVALTDRPVPRGVSDTNALGLSAEYVNGTIYVNPLPSLRIKPGAAEITMAWPIWATNFVLQEASEPVNLPVSWTNVVTKPEELNGEQVLTLPVSGSNRFYRLQR